MFLKNGSLKRLFNSAFFLLVSYGLESRLGITDISDEDFTMVLKKNLKSHWCFFDWSYLLKRYDIPFKLILKALRRDFLKLHS
mgnify:CR=1 FL=1